MNRIGLGAGVVALVVGVSSAVVGQTNTDTWVIDTTPIPTRMIVPRYENKVVNISQFEIVALTYNPRTGDVDVSARGREPGVSADVVVEKFTITKKAIEGELGSPVETATVANFWAAVRALTPARFVEATKRGRISHPKE